MPEWMLEKYIIQRFEASPGPSTHFEWHGGEPTLSGLDYFRTIMEIEHKVKPPGRSITNGIQTNGMLIDDEWAEFLSNEGFSVGLSIDGPEDIHNAYRKTLRGEGTHSSVVNAFLTLKKHRVCCNVLCVVHAGNAGEPERVYDFFKELGAAYIQFLPLVRFMEGGTVSPETADPLLIKTFLCKIFDRWISEDVGRIVIQTFDEALRPLYGIPHALCVHRQTCGRAAILEHNGNFYACDHFVDQDHLIGNINDRSIADMACDPSLVRFGNEKKEKLPGACRDCSVLESCNGGCPKDRVNGLNYLCPAYKGFFRHSLAELARLASHIKSGRPLRMFKPYLS
jgi:uncharacterized protein